ncbi:ribonuclease H-like domain-containing protein, partial [Tanacetum coccineum]
LEGIDVDETFSPIVKSGTIRAVLSLATSRHWPVHQLDVKNAFLHGDLSKTVYMHHPLGAADHGLQLFLSSTTYLVAYSNSDWAGCHTTRRSTLGYCVFLGNKLLSFSSKRQPTLSHFSTEAEYRGIANAVAETHQLTKHIEIDIHFVQDLVTPGQVRLLHVPTRYQYADIFTKGLPSALFEEFRSSLNVRCPPAQTAGEC